MANLWYKVAEYYGESSNRGQQLDSNLWKPGFVANAHIKEHRETYWKNLSSVQSPNDTVAYSSVWGDIDAKHHYQRLIHKTCLPGVEKNNFIDKLGRDYNHIKPVSFTNLRQEQTSFWGKRRGFLPLCAHCGGTIVPSRPHSEKECSPTTTGRCEDVYQLRPEGRYFHKCQHGLDEDCILHGGFDPKDAFPQGHITDEQVKDYGTSGDLETLLGSEAEHRVKNNLPINLGRNNKS